VPIVWRANRRQSHHLLPLRCPNGRRGRAPASSGVATRAGGADHHGDRRGLGSRGLFCVAARGV